MNFFKLATLVAFSAGFAHTVSGEELAPKLPSDFALNTEVIATYLVDASTTVATINPEISYTGLGSLKLTAGTTLNLWENVGTTSNIMDEFKHLPVLEFGAKYALNPKLDLEALVNYDLEAKKRNDISLVATFSF
mgnify:CR=1 FL=1|jgi:hypothetical protein|tara:strand:+ start:267 stop:671 length:405 start_codon:yes stop_codon:yes gene_type:complete